MLFHVTISHAAQDCPGRHPTEPPVLVAPSDTREALGNQLGVKLHFVLWGAACMLWAQPDHMAFAVLEAEDVESAVQYIAALVPQSWTYTALPVWNLPSQLRLIRQVRLAPPMHFGESLAHADLAESAATPPDRTKPALSSPAADAPQSGTLPGSADHLASRPPVSQSTPGEMPPDDAVADMATERQTATSGSPEPMPSGTITRLLRDLENMPDPAPSRSEAPEQETAPNRPTQIEQLAHPSLPSLSAWLVATEGPSRGKTYSVPAEGATVGRLPENPVFIPDERLSREHARIEFRDGRYVLIDVGSRNGTALNGTLVSSPQPLSNGDTIQLGSSTLVVTIQPTPT